MVTFNESKTACILSSRSLAPTHVLEGSTDKLFGVDRESAKALRQALDAEGGSHIGVDYSLTIRSASLRDPVQRRAFIAGLVDVPFENLWLRISGFGADATPTGCPPRPGNYIIVSSMSIREIKMESFCSLFVPIISSQFHPLQCANAAIRQSAVSAAAADRMIENVEIAQPV